MRSILLPLILAAGIALAGCASTAQTEPENLPEAERVGLMERLGTTLSSACGTNVGCYGLAARFAGFLWQYRESFSVQTRVYRCVGQYALGAGYRWGVRRFVSEIDSEAQATSMVTYLYECAVPEWARAWFDGEEGEPPVPPGEIAPPPGQIRTAPAMATPATPMPGTINPAMAPPNRTMAPPATAPPQLPAGARRSPAPSAPAAARPAGPAPVMGPPMPPPGTGARTRAASPASTDAAEKPVRPLPETMAPIRPSPATTP